jgi:FkbM family methyltransferase
MSLVNVASRILVSLGFRVTRSSHANRFEATEHTLRLMEQRGFAPAEIIDAGANVGAWTLMARTIFPRATIHMIEPQSGCAPNLEMLAKTHPQLRFYPTAVTRPGRRRVALAGSDGSRKGTGAWVVDEGKESPADQQCDATTVDELFGDRLRTPILLKLDLEGHELAALEGASSLLARAEVVLTEVSIFDVNDAGKPLLGDLLLFLRSRGFELYDIASLSARPRDGRLRQADAVFVRRDISLFGDRTWE